MKKKKKTQLNLRPLLILILIIVAVFTISKIAKNNSKSNNQGASTNTRSTN